MYILFISYPVLSWFHRFFENFQPWSTVFPKKKKIFLLIPDRNQVFLVLAKIRLWLCKTKLNVFKAGNDERFNLREISWYGKGHFEGRDDVFALKIITNAYWVKNFCFFKFYGEVQVLNVEISELKKWTWKIVNYRTARFEV